MEQIISSEDMPAGLQVVDVRRPGEGVILQQSGNGVREFALATAAGLSRRPRALESRFLYDARGSQLFDLITRQPEYYLTRTEVSILATHSHHIRTLTGPVSLVELGSGNSAKIEYLLRAWLERRPTVRYVAVDVSESALREAGRAITKAHPGVAYTGMNSDYASALPLFPKLSPVMVLFLGSTIGNFSPTEMESFLSSLSAALSPGDFFLVGVDLVKEPAIIQAAYNDAAGVTEQFTLNLFERMNRELSSGIDISAVAHEAIYHPDREQVEILARFIRRQTVLIEPLQQRFTIDQGEAIHTEISRKFRLERFIPLTARFGFSVEEIFTDPRNWFGLVLLRRRPPQWGNG